MRCLKGCVWDVVVDLRKDSVTYGHWHALELSPKEGNAIHIPQGCAHGFQVLEPESELLFFILANGFRSVRRVFAGMIPRWLLCGPCQLKA